MQHLGTTQIIELFHVAFLDVLANRVNSSRYVLKGGANLRYFFDSLRYSEDIDLDIDGIDSWRLEEKVDAILSAGPLPLLLRSAGLAVAQFSKPKQTSTTQRWKVALEAANRAEPVRTRIEFSNRNSDGRHRLEPIPARIVEPYALRSPSVQHYTKDAATEQKVIALAGRSETQARDVFDLDLLLRRQALPVGSLDSQILTEASERALELPFAAFRDQVLPFLERDAHELYDRETAWAEMQSFVAGKLEEAR